MKLVGACQEPAYSNGTIRVTVTIVCDDRRPLYVNMNVLREHIDFDLKEPIEVIVRNVKKKG